MSRADKAALRLSIGLGLAVLLTYGLGLRMPFVGCVMAVLVLSKPGPPMPLVKGVIVSLLFGMLLAAGVVMVPLLENYAFSALVLTAVALYLLFYVGQVAGNPLTTVLVMAFALIPVAGVADQALVSMLCLTLGVGVGVGALVSAVSSALFPDRPSPADRKPGSAPPTQGVARLIALRATVIVMPVYLLALINPSLYLSAVMKTVALGQQAGEADARSAGRELVGSTLTGAVLALAVWMGLSLWPSLWMLALWLMAAALWTGSALYGIRRTSCSPSFWNNALVTALILLGPAIEDSASGKSVLAGAAVRTLLFIAVAFYAWATLRLLECRPRSNSASAIVST
ncbi:hypothetical protein AT959_08650 [Dechloromonas denitrificans]|uniref:DUF2955 domain-containing protein n=1 Tax=Dechloromonas denitrificans TaxID=281362 RepID=A0A133XIL9_9RHOO|nr:DUF2955 domain-containing protein [Dechloromonas denitrificans]KXB30789.1 hypothetical protein AT959_08650 [Dechloromonas denitrificans]